MADDIAGNPTPVASAGAASRAGQPAIRLELTPEDQEVLGDMLDNYLSDLRVEIIDTDSSEFKKMLRHRQAVLTKIRENIRSTTEGSAGAPPATQ